MIEKIVKIRHWWRGLIILMILAGAFLKLPITFCAVKIGVIQLICPVGFLEVCLATKSIITNLLPGVILVGVLTIILGKSFCAWVCPARYAGSMIRQAGQKKMPGASASITSIWHKLQHFMQRKMSLSWKDGLAILAGLFIGIAMFDFPAYSIFCPVGILSRNLIELISHFRLRTDLVLLTVPLALSLIFKFGWKCACPMGLIRGLLATSNRTLIPVVDYDACLGCGKCMDNCSSGVSLHENRYDSFSCSKCLNCLKDCKHHAVSLRIISRQSGKNAVRMTDQDS
jgi:ferredoxin-type protein NapH